MPAVERTHSPTPEEVMAYLDGEATAAPRDFMAAHIADCGICQAVAARLRGVSEFAQEWTVESAPASLRVPDQPRGRVITFRMPAFTRSRAAMGGLGVAAAVL